MPRANYFDGKVVLITGGSSGIGLSTARILSQLGAQVWLVARNRERLQLALTQIDRLRRHPQQHCGYVVADITQIPQTQMAVAEVTRACAAPDILINCAGDVVPRLFHEMELSIAQELMAVDYFGTINMAKACLPMMIDRGSGHIVNVSSVYGFLGGYGYSAYCAAKYAVRGFSDALRIELKPLGIRVSVVFPQNTATPQLDRETGLRSPVMNTIDTTKIISADAVAKTMIRGIQRRRYAIFCGTAARGIHWLTRLMGTGVYRVMDHVVAKALKNANG